MQLASIGLPNEEAYRRDLREMLFTSPDVSNHISGVVRGGARCRVTRQLVALGPVGGCMLSG